MEENKTIKRKKTIKNAYKVITYTLLVILMIIKILINNYQIKSKTILLIIMKIKIIMQLLI